MELPAEFNAEFEPLQLIFNADDGILMLMAKIGTGIDGSKAQVAFFNINYLELSAEMSTSYSLMNFEETHRTKRHVILNLPDKETSQVLDPFSTVEQEVKLFNKILAPSINDDFLFDFKGKEVSATNLKVGTERKSLMGIPDGCSLHRPRESE